MGGHQTLPGQELHPDSPNQLNPSKDILLYTGPEHDESFLSAGVVYMSAGMLNMPGGAATVPIRSWAIRAGWGGAGALAIGLAGEWVLMAGVVGLASWLIDPLDLYQGGILPDKWAQATTVPVWERVALGEGAEGRYNLDFRLDEWGSFQ